MAENWDDKYEYLRDSLPIYHNEDYWEFLVRRVWRLDEPCRVADFGCGYGRMGLLLLRLLPPGSTYTGIDTAEGLLVKGRETFTGLPYGATFIRASVNDAPLADGAFDLALCHTVLMHVPQPERAIGEMVRVTRPGGMVITCDAVRDAHSALFHIEETDERYAAPLDLYHRMNRLTRDRYGIDYNIGTRTPVLLHKAGLKEVGCRISDAVRVLLPPVDTDEKRRLHSALCAQGLGPYPTDERAVGRWVQDLVSRGATPEEARREVARAIDMDFARKGLNYHVVWPGMLVISYGRVDKGREAAHAPA